MSSDGLDPARPRTRAEARALREALEATAEVPADVTDPASESGAGTPDRGADSRVDPTSGESSPGAVPPDTEESPDEEALRQAQGPNHEDAHGASHEDAHGANHEDAAVSAPRSRRFGIALAAVLGILVLVAGGLSAFSLTQGPRLTAVQVDPTAAIETSGSRVVFTANQSLDAIDASQVSVDPAVPFTVDASGRSVGIRFTVPLDDSTEYTVTIAGVTGTGGGPATDLTKTFTTPASEFFLLRRDAEGEDTIFRTDLTGEGVAVYSADKINDFRATSTRLVVSTADDDGSTLTVMNRDGSNPTQLELPGVGYVGAIQVSDRGGLVGYSYSDKKLSDTEGRASVLVTQPLSGGDPQVIQVGGEDASIFSWQFVPDSAAVLFIDFDGALSLIDSTKDDGLQSLGLASAIQGITRGTYTAIVERTDGAVVELNLADGSEQPLAASDPDYGTATSITPFPGGTLRHVVATDDTGMPSGQAVIRVDDDGTATPIVEVGSNETILQACASPSGQYAAVVIAPDLANNPYDQMLLPLPQNLEMHLIDLATGEEMVALTGFNASWCQTAPGY